MKAGELLILETGEYSDYTFHGPFRVQCDFDLRDQIERFLDTQEDRDWCSHYDFIAFLSKDGFIQDVECEHIHIGSYGRLKIAP